MSRHRAGIQVSPIIFKKSDDGFVKSCEFLVAFITAGIVGAAAVEHVATSVAGCVGGDAMPVRETVNCGHEWTFSVIF